MVKQLGGGKKPSLNVMIEEIERAIDVYPTLEGRTGSRKSQVDYRINILRWVRQTLQYLQENEADVRLFAQIKKLNPGAMEKLLAFVRAEQEMIKANAELEKANAA